MFFALRLLIFDSFERFSFGFNFIFPFCLVAVVQLLLCGLQLLGQHFGKYALCGILLKFQSVCLGQSQAQLLCHACSIYTKLC